MPAKKKKSVKSSKKSARKPAKRTPKKAPKKSAPKAKSAPQDAPQANWWPIILVILGLVVIGVGLYILLGSGETPAPESEVAATVNGQPISRAQLDAQYNILPEEYKAVYTKELILQQLIDEELILQFAAAEGLSVSSEEVNEEVQRILNSGELTVAELQENLARFNMTQEDFEGLIERKLLIERGMDALLTDVVAPTEADARVLYEANKESYVVSEQVTVRHILIASQRENAAQFSKDILEDVRGGADFCALVTKESDDKGSVDACGEYTFPRGYMVPEFEEASFNMAPGDMTMVQTAFGYHIIEKLGDVPATEQSFDEVKESLLTQLEQQARVVAYQEFLEEQKATADIQVFE